MRKPLALTTIPLCIFLVLSAKSVLAQMSSTNYKIPADVISGAGGQSGSINYLLQQNLGEGFIQRTASSTYGLEAGFLQSVNTTLTLTLSSNNVNFGSLNPGGSSTQTLDTNVKTDAWNGYSLSISEDHALRHTDTVTTIPDFPGTIATPVTWNTQDAFGFTLLSGTCIASKWNSGNDYAAVPTSSTGAHNTGRQYTGCPGYKAPATGADTTTVRYRLDPPTTQKSGVYSNLITFTATGSL